MPVRLSHAGHSSSGLQARATTAVTGRCGGPGSQRSYVPCHPVEILARNVCQKRLPGGRMLPSERLLPTPMSTIDMLG